MATSQSPHALILGASGISGWAVLNQIREYPAPTTFGRITGTTNRPFSLEQARIPPDDRIKLVNGIDFTKNVEDVVALLRENIEDVDTVTHVYFCAYVHSDDFQEAKKINSRILETAVKAIESVSSNLQFIVLQTGGKGYGLEFPDHVKISPPLHEDMPRIPEPWAANVFYYPQYDILKSLSQGKKWTFAEIRPDGIIGFVPGSNAMNLAQGIALYLVLWREVNGEGSGVPFPGSEKGYHSTHSDTEQNLMARMEIFVSLNPDKCGGGRVFNIADGKTVSWAQVWPGLCEYFGLRGEGPKEGSMPVEEFAKQNKNAWERIVEREGVRKESLEEQNFGHVHFMMVQFDFDRHFDLSRAREVGFTETIDTVQGYYQAFDRMKSAKVLPA